MHPEASSHVSLDGKPDPWPHHGMFHLAFYLEMALRQMLSSVAPEADYTR
ncbi:hypothetical protein KKC1_29900, partial [Calderihabitans maritimus]